MRWVIVRPMYRWIWLPALALGACGTENDQRPRTVEYITQAILAPNCGNAQCHSSFRNAEGLAFDNVERAQESLVNGLVGAIGLDARDEPEGDAASTQLINVLTRTVDRMPYDQPLPEPDIDLIMDWIDTGAKGAQCTPPAANGGPVCVGNRVIECTADFNLGSLQRVCTTGCTNGVCQ